ncbi:MAG: thiosulfate sulfurtransferase GlpE [Spongiibacteraceae bacterium]
MTTFKRISVDQAKQIIDQGDARIMDVRDQQSYQRAHIEGAVLLDNNNVGDFIANTPQDTPLIIYCYHGNSSQGVGQFFAEKGFEQVYSMDGGFEQWRTLYQP